MLVSFDNKFIRQDQKQYRNGEACRASDTFLVEPNKLHIKNHLPVHGFVYHAALSDMA